MKILILATLLIGLFTKAQQTKLTSNTWYLQKMISSNATETLAPNNSEVSSVKANFGETQMTTSVVNQFAANIFPGPDIALTDTTIFYDEYGYSTNPCQITENCTFENNYFNIFEKKLIYYTITDENNYLKLVLTHNNGNQTIYYSQNLMVNDLEKNNFKIYPNPVEDILKIESKYSKLYIQIYDSQGKIILNKIIENSKNFDIDMKGLIKGIYFMTIQTDKNGKLLLNYKIIKK